MAGVYVGYVAEAAMDALALVDVGYDVVFDVELFPLGQVGRLCFNKIGQWWRNFFLNRGAYSSQRSSDMHKPCFMAALVNTCKLDGPKQHKLK